MTQVYRRVLGLLLAACLPSFLGGLAVAQQVPGVTPEFTDCPTVVGEVVLLPAAALPATSISTASDLVGLTPAGQVAQDSLVTIRPSCCKAELVCVSSQDEIWFVSARQSHLFPCDLSKLEVSQLVNGEWQPRTLENLADRHASDLSRTTMLYVHGNRTDEEFANTRGLQFYRNTFQSRNRRPMRYVMFAWCADIELKRLYPDFGIKSERSVVVGKTFGAFLNSFADRNLLLCGFSLGSQVVLTGVTCDTGLCARGQVKTGQYRIAIVAPALDPSFISNQLLLYANNPIVAETDVFRNREDRAVKAAALIAKKRSESQITTLSQLATMGNGTNRIQIFDITEEIGRRHAIEKYSLSPTMSRKIVSMLDEVWWARTGAHEGRPR